jgi:hypothetical protein
MSNDTRRDPGDRWRLFAVAARGGAEKSQQEVDLYVELLRARQASSQLHNYGRKVWLQMMLTDCRRV